MAEIPRPQKLHGEPNQLVATSVLIGILLVFACKITGILVLLRTPHCALCTVEGV